MEIKVEKTNTHLVLRIPLKAGGEALRSCSRGLGDVIGDRLEIVIPTWLAEDLHLSLGSTVRVENQDGQLHIQPLI